MTQKKTEQRLYEQARIIRKNEWITKLELENIRRKVLQKEKDIEVNSNDNIHERFYQDEENTHKNETTQDILDLMKDNSRIELRGF